MFLNFCSWTDDFLGRGKYSGHWDVRALACDIASFFFIFTGDIRLERFLSFRLWTNRHALEKKLKSVMKLVFLFCSHKFVIELVNKRLAISPLQRLCDPFETLFIFQSFVA